MGQKKKKRKRNSLEMRYSMKIKKIFSAFIVLGILTCNASYAQDYWIFTPETTQQMQQAAPQDYYYNNNYYNENYNDNYYDSTDNNAYYGENYYNGQVTTTVPTAAIPQKEESFSEKHPILTTIGVGAALAGIVAAGFFLADSPPRHYHHPHRGRRHY